MTKIRVAPNPGVLHIGPPTCRSYGAWLYVRRQRTIHMALLTELYFSRSRKAYLSNLCYASERLLTVAALSLRENAGA